MLFVIVQKPTVNESRSNHTEEYDELNKLWPDRYFRYSECGFYRKDQSIAGRGKYAELCQRFRSDSCACEQKYADVDPQYELTRPGGHKRVQRSPCHREYALSEGNGRLGWPIQNADSRQAQEHQVGRDDTGN